MGCNIRSFNSFPELFRALVETVSQLEGTNLAMNYSEAMCTLKNVVQPGLNSTVSNYNTIDNNITIVYIPWLKMECSYPYVHTLQWGYNWISQALTCVTHPLWAVLIHITTDRSVLVYLSHPVRHLSSTHGVLSTAPGREPAMVFMTHKHPITEDVDLTPH